MFSKLKQFKDARDQAKAMKEIMDAIVVVGKSGKGVMITINGSYDVLGVSIDDGLSKEVIEKGVQDAMKDAMRQLQTELMKKMQEDGGALEALKSLGMG